MINYDGSSPFELNHSPSKKEVEEYLPNLWTMGMIGALKIYLSLSKTSKIDRDKVVESLLKYLSEAYKIKIGYSSIERPQMPQKWVLQTKYSLTLSLIAGLYVLKHWVGDIFEDKYFVSSIFRAFKNDLHLKQFNLEKFFNFKSSNEILSFWNELKLIAQRYVESMDETWEKLIRKTKDGEPIFAGDLYEDSNAHLKFLRRSSAYHLEENNISAYNKTLFEKAIKIYDINQTLAILTNKSILKNPDKSETFTTLVELPDFSLQPRRWPEQGSGWKIHVTANPHNATEVAKIAVPYLLEMNVPFKIITNTSTLQNWLDRKHTQRGKYITIYPYTYETTKKLVNELDTLLLAVSHPMGIDEKSPGDALIGYSGFLTIRYGKYIDISPGVTAPGKGYTPDSREIPFLEGTMSPDEGDEVMIKRIKGHDKIPFPDLSMHWTFPGTTYQVTWDSFFLGAATKGSWQNVIDHIDNHPELIKDNSTYETYKKVVRWYLAWGG